MGLFETAIFAALLALANADVGFSDSSAYLMTQISDDFQSLSFSLSEKSDALDEIDLKSTKYFKMDRLQNVVDASDLSAELKRELTQMCSGSLMSQSKSANFLTALSKILSQYEFQEKFEL